MFFFFAQVFSFLLHPLTWIVGLLLLSLLSKKQVLKRKLLLISFILLYAFSNAFLLDECMRMWEVKAVPEKALGSDKWTVILPGGYSSYDPYLDRVQFKRPADRLLQVLQLYAGGKIDRILLSGGAGTLKHRELKEADWMRNWLIKAGIPDSVILTDNKSDNTHENAKESAKILSQQPGPGKYLLCTSALHMRRAQACYAKAGISTLAYSCDRYSGPRKFSFDHLFLPNSESLFIWNDLLHEVIGSVVYKMMGYS